MSGDHNDVISRMDDQIERIQFTIDAEREVGNKTVNRSLTSDVMPRAILSQ